MDAPASPCNESDRVAQERPTEVPTYTISDDENRADMLLKDVSANFDAKPDRLPSNEQGNNQGRSNISSSYNPPVFDISSTDEISSTLETPSIQVMFMNTDVGRKYRHEIENFFKTLMTAESMKRDKDPLPRIQPRPNLKLDADETEISATTVIGNIEVYSMFMVDRKGWPIIANMLSQTPGVDIPQYKQQYDTEPYPPPDDDDIVETKPIRTSKTCFNCLGNSITTL